MVKQKLDCSDVKNPEEANPRERIMTVPWRLAGGRRGGSGYGYQIQDKGCS